jgi:hypothetical protein
LQAKALEDGIRERDHSGGSNSNSMQLRIQEQQTLVVLSHSELLRGQGAAAASGGLKL